MSYDESNSVRSKVTITQTQESGCLVVYMTKSVKDVYVIKI